VDAGEQVEVRKDAAGDGGERTGDGQVGGEDG